MKWDPVGGYIPGLRRQHFFLAMGLNKKSRTRPERYGAENPITKGNIPTKKMKDIRAISATVIPVTSKFNDFSDPELPQARG